MAALLLGSAATSVTGSLTEASAAPAISVFVGYADSDRAGGEFPNPWNGGSNITFDGCSPQSACTFDGGAIRVRNDNATSVSVDQIDVHISACLYTWTGLSYPVTLAPGSSLIVTQRGSGAAAGCAGPYPATFDSSDIPENVGCTNDGIQSTVDVTVDGTTLSYVDTGQVLNTGGIDPAACTNSDESTEWVRIGDKPCPGQTLSLAPAAQTDPVGTTATVSATLTDACGTPLSDVAVGFTITSGPNSGVTGSGSTDTAGAATFTYSSSITGTDSLQAAVTNAVGFTRTSNTATVTWVFPFAPGGGSFVIGDGSAAVGATVNFWGSQWEQHNTLTGGSAPHSFKGYADEPAAPACGQSWTSEPGNSTPPPDGPLPQMMAVIVTSSARQIGPEISGNITEVVVIRTDPGYEPNPGHAATGTVVAVICGGAPQGVQRPSAAQTPGGASASAQSTAPGQEQQPSEPSCRKPKSRLTITPACDRPRR